MAHNSTGSGAVEAGKQKARQGKDVADRAADNAAEHGEKAGEAVQQSKSYQLLVTLGLICYGVVHLLMAWIAIQLAWGLGGGDASTTGALQQLAGQPFGNVMLIVVAVGLFALTVWQLIEAVIGHSHVPTPKRYGKRIASLGKAVVYAALGFSAARIAAGGGQGDSNSSQESATAQLLAMPFGRALVVIAGLVILAIAVSQIVKGVRQKFTEDLAGGASRTAIRLGTAGYVAKGIALLIVGALFGFAGLSADPEQAGGTDQALRMILEQPFGPYLLTLLALGLICFGLFCFVWSRNAKHEKA
ncbi:DUF1206 domain-containing protein [Naumannella halotolerans]|uniref:DUF1206 domain-containing protein n=1 Tax=Naumannella halotolerans TaxID=993414 RepID=UPI00370D829E